MVSKEHFDLHNFTGTVLVTCTCAHLFIRHIHPVLFLLYACFVEHTGSTDSGTPTSDMTIFKNKIMSKNYLCWKYNVVTFTTKGCCTIRSMELTFHKKGTAQQSYCNNT